MIGQRGVPATFGGIERHVEELGARLASRGHDVTVFCRSNYAVERLREHRGMRLRHLPTLGTKHLDAITHSALCSVAALPGRYDVVHYHALGPGLLAPVPRYLSRAAVVQTIHGLDDQRAKWGGLAQRVLRVGRWTSRHVPDAVVTVSEDLAATYRADGRDATYIANGVERPGPAAPDALAAWGLEPGRYVLFVGRLVPEKAPDQLLRAFAGIPGELRLVLAGGSSFTNDYVAELERLAAADRRVVLTGYVYGDALSALYQHAGVFVLPSVLEGLPLTLLEAAAHGAPIVASDIPPHREVLSPAGPARRLFAAGDEGALSAALRTSLADLPGERAAASGLREEIFRRYSWDAAAEETERLYETIVARR